MLDIAGHYLKAHKEVVEALSEGWEQIDRENIGNHELRYRKEKPASEQEGES